MRYPAGTSQEVVVEMAGRPHSLWGYAAGGKEHPENRITVHSVTYIKRTPPVGPDDPRGRDYGPVGQPGYPAITVFDTDRPGPVVVADDVVVARLVVSCPVPFNVFAA
ncbi:MAG TPA: hypothetical protein VJT49_14885 [Amycolatopsis sp.]|uniref:hypothetical protein n=1 Tax=Amycolatopsis sp. TaxID=37632 RepID=UPI002B490661|nr:hypothetical protein [Amycolatopsis sp.]HKS46364.1 hypothetical protein [Amycolatopsis sp.]